MRWISGTRRQHDRGDRGQGVCDGEGKRLRRLRTLAEACKDRFAYGGVLYDSTDLAPFGNRLVTVHRPSRRPRSWTTRLDFLSFACSLPWNTCSNTALLMQTKSKWDPSLEVELKAALEAATPNQQEQAFAYAADFIDRLCFRGRKLRSSQMRAWPRSGVFGPDGKAVTGVPQEIQYATHLVAASLIADHLDKDIVSAHVFFIIDHLMDEGAEALEPTRSH